MRIYAPLLFVLVGAALALGLMARSTGRTPPPAVIHIIGPSDGPQAFRQLRRIHIEQVVSPDGCVEEVNLIADSPGPWWEIHIGDNVYRGVER